MGRQFNIAGPNVVEWHYTLPALRRLPDVRRLVESRAWFILHAPRQSGKTTAMRALAHDLTSTGRFAALHASCEAGSVYPSAPERALASVTADIRLNAGVQLPSDCRPPDTLPMVGADPSFAEWLSAWCRDSARPVVLLLDEVDSLRDDALLSMLRQLRSVFALRPAAAPSSVALIGLRDIRDYAVDSAPGSRLGTASPFNVATESLSIANFSRDDVAELYGQHGTETGQHFTREAIEAAWSLTLGQPWLVNALAYTVVHKLGHRGDIGTTEIERAKEQLILGRSTHLTSLADKLNEPRVRAVIAPILTGEIGAPPLPDDVEYCVDLGIVRRDALGLVMSNPIYHEVLPRELSVPVSDRMPMTETVSRRRSWTRPDGRLDLPSLLDAFADFWRQHGEWLLHHQAWPEAAHQLILMAFLQRLVNGGGTIEREYGLGRGRLDLLVRWPFVDPGPIGTRREDRHALELKVWRDGGKDPELAGLEQLDGYLARLGLGEGTLLIFDARATAPSGELWATRGQAHEATTSNGRAVTVWRL